MAFKYEHSEAIGRALRLDDIDTIGISSQTLAEEAIRAGRNEEVVTLVNYFLREMQIMHGILTTWIQDIVRFIMEKSGAATGMEVAGAAAIIRAFNTIELGLAPRDKCLSALAEGDQDAAIQWLDRMRLEFQKPHKILVPRIQDLLSYYAATSGAQTLLPTTLHTHPPLSCQ